MSPTPLPSSRSMYLFSNKKVYYSQSGGFNLDIALWDKSGTLTASPDLQLLVDNQSVAPKITKTAPFTPFGGRDFEKAKLKGNWYYYRLKTTIDLPSGWHMLQLKLMPLEGFVAKPLKRRLMVEPFGPEITQNITSGVDQPMEISVELANLQLPDVLLKSLTILSEVGTKTASRFHSKGVSRVYDLLTIDPGTHLITDVHVHDVPDIVTKAQILDEFKWNHRKWPQLNALSFNELSVMTALEISSKLGISLKQARRFERRFREVHMVLDRGFQATIGLMSFLRSPHSGVSSVLVTLNGQDVTDKVQATKNRWTFPIEDLSEGNHSLVWSFEFHSGNQRELRHDFTVDHSGPEITLQKPLPGSFHKGTSVTIEAEIQDQWSSVDPAEIRLLLDGKDIPSPVIGEDRLSYQWLDLLEGEHTIQISSADKLGNQSESPVWKFTIDQTPPSIHIDSPVSPFFTDQDEVEIMGHVEESNLMSLEVNGQSVETNADGSFQITTRLTSSQQEIVAHATDKAGNTRQSKTVEIFQVLEDVAVVTGKVFAQDARPLENVQVSEIKSGKVAWTDENGAFTLYAVPEGKLGLQVVPQGHNEQSANLLVESSYGRVVQVQDIYLLPVLPTCEVQETDTGQIWISAEHPNLQLEIPADAEIQFPGGQVPISMALVPSNKLPFEVPDVFPDCNAAVFGPSGLRVAEGTPMKVSLPNELSLPAGERILLIAVDGLSGGISSAGVAKVTTDERQVVSEEGHGLTHFSVVLPLPTGAQIEPYREDREVALDDAMKGGAKAHINLPAFRLLNRPFHPRLVYSSLTAAPTVHMTAIFKGLREITTQSKVLEHVHVKKEASVKRVEYFADYSLWLREFRDHVGTEYFNEKFDSSRFHFVTYLPASVETPMLPVPERLWHGGTFGPGFEWVLDRMRQQEWTIKLYQIDMSLAVTERHAVWPSAITGRYLFSDLDSGPFTLQGPPTPVGQEPEPGEEDNREVFPRLPEDMLLSYHIEPRLPDGTFYPTGLYSWLGHFEIEGRSYRQIQSSQIARKGSFNMDGIRWMLETSEGAKKQQLEDLLVVLEKAHDLHRNGPVYASKYSYGDPLDYLMNEQAGQTIIHNLADSDFGAGWKLEEQHELVPVGRNQVLAIGPEGKQVFTVANKIQKVAHVSFEKMAFSRDGSRLFAVSLAGSDWIVDRPSLSGGNFMSLVATLAGSRAFGVQYPERTQFIQVLSRNVIGKELSDAELSTWLEGTFFDYTPAFNGKWAHHTISKFLLLEDNLRHFITRQYEFALDREPTEAEVSTHLEEIFWTHYNNLYVKYDDQLHVESLMVIATDLFLSLREEMHYQENFDWYIYMYKRAFGKEPTMQELSPLVGGVARQGKNTPLDQMRSGLYWWTVGVYWSPIMVSLHQNLLGFDRYRHHGLRLWEQGEDRDLTVTFSKAGTHMRKVRYRNDRHPTSKNPQVLYQSPQTVHVYPRQQYYDGPTEPRITGLVERGNRELFVADATTHHIYRVVEGLEKSEEIRTKSYHSGYIFGDWRRRVVLGAGHPRDFSDEIVFQYYDASGNLLDLPEEEAKWVAAYREYDYLEGVQGGIYTRPGFTPDGHYKDQEDGKLLKILIDTPGGLAIDHKDRLCFAETGNHRVRLMDFETGELTTIAGNGGSSGYDPKVNDARKTAIPEPIDVAISKRREVFFLFHIGLGQQCIGKVDRAGFYTHVAGSPIPGTGTLDTGTDARYFKLTGGTSLAVSSTGELFITLANQHRVMVVTPDGYIDTAAGNGESGNPNDGAPALQASLGTPNCIACDKQGNLIINDQLHKSLRIVNLATCEHWSETQYQPPLGYFDATLVRHRNGQWTKRYTDGGHVSFDRQGKHLSTIDRCGNETRYRYEADRLIAVEYPMGGRLDLMYDDHGKLLSIKDHVGRMTKFQVDNGLLQSVVRADEAQIDFAYDRDGRVLEMKLAHEVIAYRYNEFGRLIAQTTNGQLTQIERPDDLAAGNLSQENQDALIAYQNHHATLSAEGNQVSYRLDHGRVVEYIATNGSDHKIQYNLQGLPEVITRPSGSQVLYNYNLLGQRIREEDTHTGRLIETVYDEHGRKISEQNDKGIKALFEYDEEGNLLRSWLEANGQSAGLIENTYNDQGLIISREKQGVITTYGYDAKGNLGHEQRGILNTQLQRDEAGNIIHQQKGGILQKFHYSPLNQLLRVEEGGQATDYQYDARSNLVKISAANQTNQKLRYDGRSRMVAFKNPNGKVWRFEYDWEDRVTSVVFPDGKELKREWSGTSGMTAFAEGETAYFSYFEGGDPRSAFNGDGGYVHLTDEAGRIITQYQVVEDDTFQLDLQLDTMNNIMRLQSDGDDLQYEYSAFGKLTALACNAWRVQFQYDDHGRLSALVRDNGWDTQISYDDAGFARQIAEVQAGTVKMQNQVAINAAGHTQSMHRPEGDWQAQYDEKGQLIGIEHDGDERSYTYDEIGNRLAGPEGSYQYDGTGQLLQACPHFTYQWDDRGQMTEKVSNESGERHFYAYNDRGQLTGYQRYDDHETAAVEATYLFDGAGRRVKKVVTYRDEPDKSHTRRWVYHGENLFLELDEEGAVRRQYIAGSQLDSWMGFLQDGKGYYYLKDHMGSSTGIVDDEGEVVARYTYDEFGQLQIDMADIDNSLTYTGREWDEESGLYYYRMRNYDPALGRFIQPDPYLGSAKESRSLVNRYIYVHNNPLTYRDPSGLKVEDALAAIGNAGVWVATAVWELLKWLLTPNGEALGPVEAGPEGNYRDSFDVTRANNAILEGYWDAQEWIVELLAQTIGTVLQELWNLVSDLFDWKVPDIELPLLSDVVGSGFDDQLYTNHGQNLWTQAGGGSNNKAVINDPNDNRIEAVGLSYGVFNVKLQPNDPDDQSVMIDTHYSRKFSAYGQKPKVLIIRSTVQITDVALVRGGIKFKKLDPKTFGNVIHYEEDGRRNPESIHLLDYGSTYFFYFEVKIPFQGYYQFDYKYKAAGVRGRKHFFLITR